MSLYPFEFSKLTAYLVERINRFVVAVEIDNRRAEAYLANPGRLWELLLPGTELLLSPALSRGKLPYTVLACRKENRYVLLHTHLTNQVIQNLISEKLLPSYENYRVIKTEPACGRHRFDLLLEHTRTGEKYYLEIKSCTLFSGKIAMFPDAVTKRGSDHLSVLQKLSRQGIKTGCLFVAMNPEVKYFLPAYHIDYRFSQIFQAVMDTVRLDAVSLDFDHSFTYVTATSEITIPLNIIKSELRDSGVYLLVIALNNRLTLNVGSLGQMDFQSGYYIYVGSAMQNLKSRVARHLQKKKQKRWHVDYLIAEAERVIPVPIVSSEQLECPLASDVGKLADSTVNRFGSSDCHCPGHLFYFKNNPLLDKQLIELIQYYRIKRLEEKLS